MSDDTALYENIRGFFVGLLAGVVLMAIVYMSVSASGGGAALEKEAEQPTVSCTSFVDESGEASGLCFVSGDVRFRWLDDARNATNGTVTLDGLPEENSTVRREQ